VLHLGLEERRKRERENHKNAIIRAARRLFFEKGFKSVTVESIAKKAELSKGAIYLHYNSKEEIYAQILISDIGKFHNRFSELLKKSSSASDALLGFADIYVDFSLNDSEVFRSLMNFMIHATEMHLPPNLYNESIKITNRTINIIDQIFEYGIERGEFSANINSRVNRNAVWGMLNGIISLYLFTSNEEKKAEIIRGTVREGIETFLRGLKVAQKAI
jgi:AcrR family transcriptional regulator